MTGSAAAIHLFNKLGVVNKSLGLLPGSMLGACMHRQSSRLCRNVAAESRKSLSLLYQEMALNGMAEWLRQCMKHTCIADLLVWSRT